MRARIWKFVGDGLLVLAGALLLFSVRHAVGLIAIERSVDVGIATILCICF